MNKEKPIFKDRLKERFRRKKERKKPERRSRIWAKIMDSRIVRKLAANRFLNNYPVILVLTAAGLYLAIETLARHSLIQSLIFLVSQPLVTLCNVLLILALISLGALFRKRIFATVMLSMVWLILGIVNGIILANRMTPFTVKDMSNMKDGMGILTTYFSLTNLILIGGAIVALVVGIVFLYRKTPKLKEKVNYKKALALVAVAFVAAFGVIQMSIKAGVLDTFFPNLAYAYRDNGVPYCFLVTWVNTGVDKTEGYSEESVKDVFYKGELGDDGIYTPGKDDDDSDVKKPNVIYLQLESFMDPARIDGVKFSKDPVPNHKQLMKDYSSGYLRVPAVGAGTANVEFEVMTGMSVKFFGPGEYPYKSVLKDTVCEAAPYDFRTMGYSSHAIHNHRGAFYGRNKVFANMGFDTFTCLEYMNDVEKTPKNWAKDALLTGEILDAMESTKGTDYIYTISVQGHGKYPTEEVIEDPEIKVTEAETEEQKWAYEYYVNQIYEMDQFIKELTDTLEDYDEDVVLVMYGDHLPALDMTEEKVNAGSMWQTEYIVWDNFGLEKKDMDIEAYRLNAEIMDRLGMHTGLLNKYHQDYSGTDDYMKNLKMLTYDMLYGDRYIYGGKLPYEKTDLKMGVKDIKIKEIVQIGEDYYIKGQNFTEFSKVSLDGEVLKTVYLGPNVLALKEEVDLEDVSRMKVSQVEKNKEILSTTE